MKLLLRKYLLRGEYNRSVLSTMNNFAFFSFKFLVSNEFSKLYIIDYSLILELIRLLES